MTEEELRVALMHADLFLKTQQGRWETPRNLAIIVGVIAALVSAGAGIIGFKIGQASPAPLVVKLLP